MSTSTADSVLDAALDKIATCNLMIALDAVPANRAAAISAALASQAMVGGDFSNGDRTGGGREVTVAAKNSVSISANGNFNHVVYVDATEILHIKQGTTQALTSGGTVNFPSTTIGIGDPTVV